MSSSSAAFLLLLTLIATTATSSSSSPILGLDTFLSHQSRHDPNASNDSFLSLSSSLRRSLSLSSTATSSLASSLLSLTLPLSLHVRLVGSAFPSSSATLLSSFLAASHTSDHFHVITPDSAATSAHRLALKHSLHLDVTHSPSLAASLSKTLAAELASTASSLRSPLVSVNYDAVDRVIHADFEKQKPVHGVYLYFLDLGPQAKTYAYSSSSGDSSSTGVTKCLWSVWTGSDRYIWIDLGAGPVDYGPALSGDGVLPKGEFHPLAALHGTAPKAQKALLADLASLISSAYQVLLVPSLRIPVQYENQLIVQFIHVYGGESVKDTKGLDWKSIERSFREEAEGNSLLLGDQSLTFKNYNVKYSECSICSFAIARSINSYTSRFLFDNYTLIASEYLDSKRLHQILTESVDEFRRVAGFPEEDFGRVLPVYVFDLDYNMLLLLDRYHQTVAFKDMVIAVRTRNSQTVSDYSCNGRHVFTQTRELERPLVGSILQSMWGVSPTHMVWSPRHNTTLVDYTWSVGHTPFGPFSEISSLSFVQKDAAKRNVLLTSLNYSISSSLEVLESIAAHGGESKVLKRNQHVEFLQRWNFFKYKLDKAVSAMSHLDFEMALYYMKSSDHDLYAIHSLVYDASQELEASLVCFTDPPFPWSFVSVVVVLVILGIYINSRGRKLFRSKSKRF